MFKLFFAIAASSVLLHTKLASLDKALDPYFKGMHRPTKRNIKVNKFM